MGFILADRGTRLICGYCAERCLFEGMVGLKNKRREEHEPELCLVMVKCKIKWNKNRYFDSPGTQPTSANSVNVI